MNPAWPFENKIWDPVECLPRPELQALQLDRLQDCVRHVAAVPFYARAFRELKLHPESIKSLDDVRRLPFTTKEDLRQQYPTGFLAVPREKIVRFHGSSGTTGKPTLVAYTREDLVLWSNLVARFLVAGGVRPEHTAQVAFGYGLFTGGFGLHYGLERVGCAVVPVSSGNTMRQLLLIRDLGVEVLICTPSYALTIAEEAKASGLTPQDLPLKIGHFGGEPWSEEQRRQIEAGLGIQAFNNYGLSEIMGPGVSGECAARTGMHLQEDHFLVECLNPDTLEPVKPGDVGELVITTLTKNALPLLRYRTRDLASLETETCACGRTTARMSRVLGRSDDMLIVRGCNIFPTQIEEALLRVEGTAPHYLIEVRRPGTLDEMTIKVEIRPESFSDKMSNMQLLHDRLDREIQAITGIRASIELVKPQSLERFSGKAKRVIDHRKPSPNA
jgi:phenylacetate-CoA ligase